MSRPADRSGSAFPCPDSLTVRLQRADDFDGWRNASRELLARGIAPDALVWDWGAATADLFGDPGVSASAQVSTCTESGEAGNRRGDLRVPKGFIELARCAACHRDPDRFALLYRVVWRRSQGEEHLLEQTSDPDMHRLHRMARNVSRERHKMHAFVRFRQTPGVEPEHFMAWFEPEHHTLRLSCDFFVRRFANMHWSIITPEDSAHWNGDTLHFGPGGRREDGPTQEAMETLWQAYFANIFNPARLKVDAMRAEMAVRYWKNLPEAPLIGELVRQAGQRTASMIDAAPTTPPRYARQAEAPRAVPMPADSPAADGSQQRPAARTADNPHSKRQRAKRHS